MGGKAFRLVLFDIDGTLIRSGGAGRRAMNQAFAEVYGIENGLDGVEMMGRTDPLILREVLHRHGFSEDPDRIARFQTVYFTCLEREMALTEKRLCPGVLSLLEALHAHGTMVSALLTGNWRRGAEIKLSHLGIWDRFPFGAFADDAAEREALVPIAMDRFHALYGRRIPPRHVFVIGDTPQDVLCARPHGVVTIAVATGIHSPQELAAAGPHFLFPELSDTKALLALFSG